MVRILCRILLISLFIPIVIAGASEVSVTGLSLTPSSTTMYTGWQIQLQLIVMPFNAGTSEIMWESSDTSIATVSGGLVEAISPGEAKIRAYIPGSGVQAECVVFVMQNVVSTTAPTESTTPTNTPTPSGSPAPTGSSTPTGSSSPSAAVTQQPSSTHSPEPSATASPEIIQQPSAETTVETLQSLLENTGCDMALLLSTGRYVNIGELTGNAVIEHSITWYTSDDRIANVDQAGFVYAIGPGKCTITAVTGENEFSLTVAVINPAAPSNTLKPEVSPTDFFVPKTLIAYGQVDLTTVILVLPIGSRVHRWNFVSDNPFVAVVDSSGIVKALAPGIANISISHDLFEKVETIKLIVP